MKLEIKNLENKAVGHLSLSKEIFELEPRKDILHRVVRWQLAKRRAGTHKTKGITEISGTGKKPWRQKGTGRARAGSLRAPQMRGGATIFGPVVRSHAHKLTKKFRQLGLKMALSGKATAGKLIVLDSMDAKSAKTKDLKTTLSNLGLDSALFIDNANVPENFAKASSNLFKIDALPVMGINVYDIMRRDTLVMTKAAVEAIEGRLS